MMEDDHRDSMIHISIKEQRLQLRSKNDIVMDVIISTAKNGPGEVSGSECPPRGLHLVRAMIGFGAKANTVFVGRRPTSEIYSPELRAQFPERDWILTRILWLSGLEPGKNRLGTMDTMRRYIYIHGCPDEDMLGVPGSHGCIKMRNADVITLFDKVKPGIKVAIHEGVLPAH